MGLDKRKPSATPSNLIVRAPRVPSHRGLQALLITAVVIGVLLAFRWSLRVLRQGGTPSLLMVVLATVLGIGGVWLLYWAFDRLINVLPLERLQQRLRPWLFVGPAIALLMVYLVYPTIYTIWLSLHDRQSQNFVGLRNYAAIFTESALQKALTNNLQWLVIVTVCSVVLGLVIAVLVDRVRYESVAKSLIFLPLAISFVGASVIWRFVYAYQPPSRPQIGILNAGITALGGEPIGWLIERQFNNYALMLIMIWLQTGFCMVILSAALKGISSEVLDAARIDGAGEGQVFLHIIIPSLRPTIITVATAVLIAVLKVFDIVFVMTSGQHGTEVIANRMYAEMFRYRDFGRGSALAVILLIAVLPVIVVNVRNLRRQRGEA